ADLAAALREEARRANERRLLVLAGDRDACVTETRAALAGADIGRSATTLVAARETPDLNCERIAPKRADALLGTTRECVVLDCHDECRPNALGRTVGAVDGGGLLVLLTPPLDEWPARRDDFDATLAVEPFDVEDVAGNFRQRLVETLHAHRGVAIVNVDSGTVKCDGLTDPPPRPAPPELSAPEDRDFPLAAFEACLTADQADCVAAFEALQPGRALVVEADRGRGKSSAAGLAAGALAAGGTEILVTAPAYRSAAAGFERARDLLDSLGVLAGTDCEADPHRLDAAGGGRVWFESPERAVEGATEAD